MHHNARTPSGALNPLDLDLRSAGAGDLIQFIQIPQSSPSTDCILLASRRDIHDTVTRIDERKLEKLLAALFDNGHVFPSFQVSLLSHVARDYREICTRYDTLESYFRKLEI